MSQSTESQFYVVSMGKFSALYFGTMGFYALYWFYRAWVTMEEQTGRRLFPVLRTIFAVFFVHELFGYVRGKEKQQVEQPYPWEPAKLAWLFIAIGAIHVVLTLMNVQLHLGCILRTLIFLSLLLLQFYVLYKVQLVINRMQQDPFGSANATMTFRNNMWMAFGVFMWVNTVFGCYLEMTGQLPPPGERAGAERGSSTTPTL